MAGSMRILARATEAPLCALFFAHGVAAQSLAPDIAVSKTKPWPAVMANLEKRFLPK